MPAQWIDLPYRVRRRLARTARRCCHNLGVAWDSRRFRACTQNLPPREILAQAAGLAPWHDHGGRRPAASDWADGDEQAAMVAAADQARAHRFDLLGSGPVDLGPEINWHRDFKSGYRWNPAIHHSAFRWNHLPPGVDIKVPWELSRCMHFATLGLAGWITGRSVYYLEFKLQLRHWIAANPVGRGVNWACAMDVAIRAVNWLVAIQLFGRDIAADDDPGFPAELTESLWHHGLHVGRNLEWSGPRGPLAGNHFVADLAGLLAIGATFRQFHRGRRWLRFAKARLEREITRQVFDDGTNYETSTSYHRLVLEMFLWADTLAERAGEPFSTSFRDRLARMTSFVAAYSAPGGTAAQFGDNDNGRLLASGIGPPDDHRYLRPGPAGFGAAANRLLLRGSLPLPACAAQSDGSFPRGGFWFLRAGPAWAGLRAGPVSHVGVHAHCDQLSLVLSVHGHEILVDRGTGVYSPDPAKRNLYRSTASHNTLQVNGWEQNTFGAGRSQIFRMGDDTRARVQRWQPAIGTATCEAEHLGFARFRPGMCCRRTLVLGERSLQISDQVTALVAGDELRWSFHFNPGLQLDLQERCLLVRSHGLRVSLVWDFGAVSSIEDVSHSPCYGHELPAQCLRLMVRCGDPIADKPFVLSWSW